MKKTCLLLALTAFSTLFSWAQNPDICQHLDSPGDPICQSACIRCSLEGYLGSTTGFQAGQAPGFCNTLENSQWLSFLAGGDSIAIQVVPAGCLSGDGIELALYSDCSATPLACAPGETGGGGTARTITASVVPGQQYFLLVDGFQGDQCGFIIHTSPAGAVASPVPVLPGPPQGPSIVASYSTLTYSVSASPYATEYHWSGPPGSRINGQPTPATIQGPAGAQVNVTFGNQGGSLCVTASNDCNAGPAVCRPVTIGGPLFPPCPSNTEPAADLCSNACVYCNFVGYAGATKGYTADPAPGFCGTIDNNQWLGFIASQSSITLTAQASNCSLGHGLQMALYQNCAEPPVACNQGQVDGASLPVTLTAAVMPNQQYFLMVDGMLGDQCDFTVSVQPPMAGTGQPMGTPGPIQGPAKLCPGATVQYSIDPVAGAGGYVWTVPPGWQIYGQTGSYTGVGAGANTVVITAGNNSGVISVTPVNNCNSGTKMSKTITVQPIPPTFLPPITVCAEDAPFYLPWGTIVNSSGLYCTTYTSYLGCDSTVCQNVTIMNPIIFIYPPQKMCNGETFTVCGNVYDSPGSFVQVCESYKGCDSSVYFILQYFGAPATIIPSGDILCATPPVTLSSAPVTNGVKTWKTLAGQVLSHNDTLNVTQSGTYILTVTLDLSTKICLSTDTIQVQVSANPPVVAASGGNLNCSTDSIQVSASSNIPGGTYAWTGPGGFSSTVQNPVVHQAGVYSVTLTDPVSGCTAQATASVTVTHQAPQISPVGGFVNCANPVTSINCFSNITDATYLWAGPNGFIAAIKNPFVSDTGLYRITVTDPANGCTATGSVTVTGDFQAPSVQAAGDLLNCAHPYGMVTCTTDALGGYLLWQGPFGFSSGLQNPQIVQGGKYDVTVTSANGCTASASVTVLEDFQMPDVAVQADTLNCTKTTVQLLCNTNATSPVFAWSGPNNFHSVFQNPTVTQPGLYTVTVTDNQNGCADTATATVLATDLPQITLTTPDSLTCSQPSVMLNATTNALQAVFQWSGPGGFNSGLPNPAVETPGQYTLLVTDLATNCTAIAVSFVEQNIAPPGAQATGIGVLTCIDTLAQVAGSSPTPGAVFEWSGPGIAGANTGDTIEVNAPGDYSLVVTDPVNGCTSAAVASILNDILPPVLVSWIPDTLDCATDSVLLAPPPLPNVELTWMFPDGATSTGPSVWVTEPGLIGLTAVSLSNGCTSMATVEVPIDTAAPTVSVVQVINDLDGQGTGAIEIAVLQPVNYLVVWKRDTQIVGTGLAISGLPAGTYTALVTGSNACTASLDIAVQNTLTATHDPAALAGDWRVFPNPTGGLLQVRYAGGSWPDTDISLLNVNGMCALSRRYPPGSADASLRLDGLPAGTYILLIRTAAAAVRHTVILQR